MQDRIIVNESSNTLQTVLLTVSVCLIIYWTFIRTR